MDFDLKKFDVKKFDAILDRGLSHGLGKRGEQVCIEAAICQVLDLPHGDDPGCVDPAVRALKIALNDAAWSSPQARARGLRDLGLAQLGSKGVIDSQAFAKRTAEQTIRILIPKLFRQIFSGNAALIAAADRCEKEGSDATADAADAADAATAARYAAATAARYAAADAARYAAAATAARYATAAATAARYAAADAADAARCADQYLNLSAQIALDVLKELKSPGVALLEAQ